MSDYISREAVLDKLLECGIVCIAAQVKGVINSIPAADVREVKRGVWLNNKYRRRCKDCGCAGSKDWKFCPVCGREMVKEEDDG